MIPKQAFREKTAMCCTSRKTTASLNPLTIKVFFKNKCFTIQMADAPSAAQRIVGGRHSREMIWPAFELALTVEIRVALGQPA